MRNHNPMPGSRYKDSHGAVVTVQRVEHTRQSWKPKRCYLAKNHTRMILRWQTEQQNA